MAVIHEEQRTVSFKIVYGGPPLGGKTTNVQHIHSCLDPDTRSDLVSLASAADRTLFFDFLAIDAPMPNGYQAKFHLYTVPGQVLYNATYQLVLRQADGIVFVADSQMDRMVDNIQAWEILQTNLKRNGQSLDRIPLVLQYNKRDLPNVAPIEYMEYLLNSGERRFYSYEGAAAHGHNVLSTLNTISHSVLTRFNAMMEAERQNATVEAVSA
ncbi:GTPase domain-containing protein [Phragmitibacter flavus]|uniref:GTPase domain-containing protein n=1 Tax=Phragmitibacter flavus TaxID=2576071 RepID=A0A5R8KCT1_9BACT|nr:GTPase domain-containing protein [Phragmitibacter flavus]TLD70108.1 GTPase domain-containing protein [Phragmitibacter flavus]